MVSKLKKLWWKIYDLWSSYSRRCEIDIFFHIVFLILQILTIYFLLKK